MAARKSPDYDRAGDGPAADIPAADVPAAETAVAGAGTPADTAAAETSDPARSAAESSDPARPAARRGLPVSSLWLSVFGASLGLFIIRFLVPTPVGQADNHDGPRLMCTFGVTAATNGHTRFFRYAYFDYVAARPCASAYPSSQLVPLELARILTPVLGLAGKLNLIALGLLTCAVASAGIASLATGLRLRLWARLAVAGAVWLIMADAAFFDTWASPFSEPAALIGILLVAAGVVRLGQDRRSRIIGLVLAGSGGFLAILSKEQYTILIVPVCLTLILASAGPGRGLRRFRTRQVGAAAAICGVLAFSTAVYAYADSRDGRTPRLRQDQVVDVIFRDIVTGKDSTAKADLRALSLPVSWVRYAGRDAFVKDSVRTDPLFHRYQAQLSDANLVQFLITHPSRIVSIGQHAAQLALRVRNTSEGNYAPSAGHRPGALESRVVALTWLMRQLPAGLGLLFLVPLWLAMAAIGLAALYMPRSRPWRRDGAVMVLCMTGCAIAAFIPPAYFDGVSTTRHMVGMNLALALAATGSAALLLSLIHQAVTGPRRHREPAAAVAGAGPDETAGVTLGRGAAD